MSKELLKYFLILIGLLIFNYLIIQLYLIYYETIKLIWYRILQVHDRNRQQGQYILVCIEQQKRQRHNSTKISKTISTNQDRTE